MEKAHMAAGMCGLVLDPCDAVDAGLYAWEREYAQAAVSGTSMVPGLGIAVGLVRLNRIIKKGGLGPITAGQIGETSVRGMFDIGPKKEIVINGRKRIPDGITKWRISEVKNVKYQHFSRQLKDDIDYARNTGLEVDLYVRTDTKLSGPLVDAISDPAVPINLRYIPTL